jgi:hypothetical protein
VWAVPDCHASLAALVTNWVSGWLFCCLLAAVSVITGWECSACRVNMGIVVLSAGAQGGLAMYTHYCVSFLASQELISTSFAPCACRAGDMQPLKHPNIQPVLTVHVQARLVRQEDPDA